MPITIHIVSRVTSHLVHHMVHQFQKGINAESVEEQFMADTIIA